MEDEWDPFSFGPEPAQHPKKPTDASSNTFTGPVHGLSEEEWDPFAFQPDATSAEFPSPTKEVPDNSSPEPSTYGDTYQRGDNNSKNGWGEEWHEARGEDWGEVWDEEWGEDWGKEWGEDWGQDWVEDWVEEGGEEQGHNWAGDLGGNEDMGWIGEWPQGGNPTNQDDSKHPQKQNNHKSAVKSPQQAAVIGKTSELCRLCKSIEKAALEEDITRVASLLARRCELYRRRGQPGLALLDAEACAEVNPDDGAALLRRGIVRLEIGGDDSAALKDITMAYRLNGNLPKINQWMRRAKHWSSMKKRPNYYHTLGVHIGTTPENLRRAYRHLALRWHPDKAGGNSSKFREIQSAWEVLGDTTKRKEYDFGHAKPIPNRQHDSRPGPMPMGVYVHVSANDPFRDDPEREPRNQGMYSARRSGLDYGASGNPGYATPSSEPNCATQRTVFSGGPQYTSPGGPAPKAPEGGYGLRVQAPSWVHELPGEQQVRNYRT